jgi:pimeloyl-ACP methyl ester carboxylesterase
MAASPRFPSLLASWLIMAIAFLLPALCPAQTLRYILPSQTDPDITQFDNFHIAALNTNIASRHQLMVFLPGTGGTPSGYTNVIKAAANFGFHSIGLTYDNPTTLNSLCGDSTDADCYAETRLAIINGGTNDQVSISQADSVTNRLTKLLIYLVANYPAQNWAQYLNATSNINWPQIVIAGHSQGAGHAGIIAKNYPVSRSVMFSDTDWWTPGGKLPGMPADWISAPGITPTNSYFGFVHTNDPLILYAEEIPTWDDYGLAQFGGPTIVEDAAFPYAGSHMLTTGLTPDNFTSSAAYHGATVSDQYTPLDTNGVPVYLGVWQYMMTAPPQIPEIQITPAANSSIQLAFFTVTNCTYQLQTSVSVQGPWVNNGANLNGTGTTHFLNLTQTPGPLFYRLAVDY